MDPRVAVSAVQVGLVSRLWSAALAPALLLDWVPDLRLPALDVLGPVAGPWRPAPAGEPAGRHTGASAAGRAAALAELVLPTVRAVSEACAGAGRTAPRVLVSNAASALVGGAGVVGRRHPGVAADADELVGSLLDDPWLADGGATDAEGFRRSGCCLFYRLPGHGLCPDCVLVRPGRPASEH